MRDSAYLGCTLTLALALACGGAETPQASSADEAVADRSGDTPSEPPAATQAAESDEPKHDHAEHAGDKPADVPAPSFKENGSVKEAVDAVPQGTQRLNIDQEALGRPLNDVKLYEPCKPGNQHFKAKVAIWDGKAVGLDLTTTPKSQKFADCIAERIRSITWPDKVKSLNTVEYIF
jgi:hypothetical protein